MHPARHGRRPFRQDDKLRRGEVLSHAVRGEESGSGRRRRAVRQSVPLTLTLARAEKRVLESRARSLRDHVRISQP